MVFSDQKYIVPIKQPDQYPSDNMPPEENEYMDYDKKVDIWIK
jgi:hypothetical protein